MSSLRLLSSVLVLLSIFQHGLACSKADIAITQRETGRIIEGGREYEVTVANTCACPQSGVTVRCYGLSSVESVDAGAIRPVDNTYCVVNGGRPLVKGSPVKFRYAWMTPQDFPVAASRVNCA